MLEVDCVCVSARFYNLLGTFACINTNVVRTSRAHGDQNLVLMRQNVIPKVLVEFSAKVWIEVRLRLGLCVS